LKNTKPIKPKVSIEIASDSMDIVEPIPIIAGSYQHGNKPDSMLLGYGSSNFMVFEQFLTNYKEKLQVLVRTDPKKILLKSKKKSEANKGTVLKTLTPIADKNDVEYKSAVNVPKKKLQNEIPMETRLKKLNLDKMEPQETQSKVQLLIQSLHSQDQT